MVTEGKERDREGQRQGFATGARQGSTLEKLISLYYILTLVFFLSFTIVFCLTSFPFFDLIMIGIARMLNKFCFYFYFSTPL